MYVLKIVQIWGAGYDEKVRQNFYRRTQTFKLLFGSQEVRYASDQHVKSSVEKIVTTSIKIIDYFFWDFACTGTDVVLTPSVRQK
jgi:hypothetical protein